MKKLGSLRSYLLQSALALQPDDLLTFAEEGKVISYSGETNQHFQIEYIANIIITGYSGDVDEIAYLLLQWLKQNQPNHKEDAIEFDADILDQSAVDLSLKIELSEIIKVRTNEQGAYLKSCAEPNLAEILIPNQELALAVKHNSAGKPERQHSD